MAPTPENPQVGTSSLNDGQERKAEDFARHAFSKTVDRMGRPAIFHVEAVVAGCWSSRGRTIAWLHDIVEDTNVTLADLHLEGFDENIVDTVGDLTKQPKERYEDYIERVRASGSIAIEVKHADLRHNRSRAHELDEKTAEHLIKRYDAALAIIAPLDVKPRRKNRPGLPETP